MDQQITVRVRPGEAVRFPGLCVACGRPAAERITLYKRRGQLTRRLEAPLCADCARQLARRSGQEERLLRLRWPAVVVTVIMVTALVFAALPINPWWFRLAVGLAVAPAAGALVHRALSRRAEAAELPERRAVREAARIVDFTWRDMTLAFANQRVLAEVAALNADVLATEAPADETDPAKIITAEDNSV